MSTVRADSRGAFLMGSDAGQDDERPVHAVHVDAFEMAVHPVTRAEYARFLDGHRATIRRATGAIRRSPATIARWSA